MKIPGGIEPEILLKQQPMAAILENVKSGMAL